MTLSLGFFCLRKPLSWGARPSISCNTAELTGSFRVKGELPTLLGLRGPDQIWSFLEAFLLLEGDGAGFSNRTPSCGSFKRSLLAGRLGFFEEFFLFLKPLPLPKGSASPPPLQGGGGARVAVVPKGQRRRCLKDSTGRTDIHIKDVVHLNGDIHSERRCGI
jgi:hypothetical protein